MNRDLGHSLPCRPLERSVVQATSLSLIKRHRVSTEAKGRRQPEPQFWHFLSAIFPGEERGVTHGGGVCTIWVRGCGIRLSTCRPACPRQGSSSIDSGRPGSSTRLERVLANPQPSVKYRRAWKNFQKSHENHRSFLSSGGRKTSSLF